MHDKNIKLAGVEKGALRSGSRVLGLRYAKSDSQILFAFMYYSPDIHYLKRKHDKFVAFFKLDPYAT